MAILSISLFVAVVSCVNGYDVKEMEINADMNWKDLNVGTFSWSTCNKTVVPVAFTKFELTPDPLQFGQPLIFSGQVFVGEKIGTGNDVNAKMQVMMKLDTQEVDICVYRPEYCNIKDVCKWLTEYVSPKCPSSIQKFCKCPYDAGQYPIPPLRYDVPTPPVTVQGQFNITLQLFERDKQIGCLNVHLCIGQC